jgi:hypothetical protein
MTVDDGHVRGDPGLDQVMGDHVPDRIHRMPREEGEKGSEGRIEIPERFLQLGPDIVGEPPHQRTFRA